MSERQAVRLWVFDRPILRDPLFLVALVLTAAGILVYALLDYRILWLPLQRFRGDPERTMNVWSTLGASILGVGVTGGSFRGFVRGRRERAHRGA
jgi:hypothetical protein